MTPEQIKSAKKVFDGREGIDKLYLVGNDRHYCYRQHPPKP